jgi:hypothetical protein
MRAGTEVTGLPGAAVVQVERRVANQLYDCAERLPRFENRDFYLSSTQERVRSEIRESSRESLDWLIGEIRARLLRPPYTALVRGLSFDCGNRLFVAINRSFGEMVALPYKEPRAQLVHYIQPSTDLPSPRGGLESERLHTDTTDWASPIDYISMTCVRPDPGGGGRTKLMDIDSIRDEVCKHLGQDAILSLGTISVPWRLSDSFGGGIKWRPVLSESQICWRRYTIDQAMEALQTKLADETISLLDSFEQLITRSTRAIEFLMGEGDFLISNNLKTIHARTTISDGQLSDRLMIRGWVTTQ